jgi:hypothetical protein
LPEDSGLATDPDVLNVVEVAMGLAIGAATEAWYVIAHRMGWAK